MFSKRHNILILTMFLALLLGACTTSPTGRSQMILKSDTELEAQASIEFAKLRSQAPLVIDQATVGFVHCVAIAIVESLLGPEKDLNWELAVIDTQEQNAFVMPGGKIAVYEGILSVATNQNELATVMGIVKSHARCSEPVHGRSPNVLRAVNRGVQSAEIIGNEDYDIWPLRCHQRKRKEKDQRKAKRCSTNVRESNCVHVG